jgi:hypothetical protein
VENQSELCALSLSKRASTARICFCEKLAQEGVQFAHPTRTLYLRQDTAAGN